MTFLDAGLAFLAGLLTVLSPCVLPILPIVFAGAAGRHRFGPAALAIGVAVSFTAAGLFLATIGFDLGLDAESLRPGFGLILLLFGLILLVPRLQVLLEVALAPVAQWGATRGGGLAESGLLGQFGLGCLLGAVWSPCVGPTLGAASLLASRGEHLSQVAGLMFLFGIGAALPLLGLGLLSRAALLRIRGRLAATGRYGRMALGIAMTAAGLLVATGGDKMLETILIDVSPAWLTDLTTRY